MRLPSYKFSSSPPRSAPIDHDHASSISPPPSPPILASTPGSASTSSAAHTAPNDDTPPRAPALATTLIFPSPSPSPSPAPTLWLRTRRASTSTVPTIARSFNRPHSDSLPPPYEPPPPGMASASSASLSVKRPTAERAPSVLVLFREDYQRTRIYVKEMDYRLALRKALRKHMYKWYAILIIVVVISILVSTKHETIVNFCEPLTRRIREWPAGWLIPEVLLIVVSFPPLLGHEIIGILCGLVWGLGVGFAILAAGTFLGEIATWIAFKWFCTARAAKFEKKNKLYASLTQTIREKSFMFVLVLRFSAVPGHITTAVSASAGANFWQYLAAAFLTLPKQLTIVYLGKAFGQKNTKNTIISAMTTILTLIGTIIAAVYIWYQMRIVMLRQTQIQAEEASISRQVILEEDEEAGIGGMSMAQVHIRRQSTGALGTAVRIERVSDDVAKLLGPRPWSFEGSPRLTASGSGAGLGALGAGGSGSGSGLRTPSRTWSLPGPLTDEEMKEWMEGLESGRSTPKIRIEDVTAYSTATDDYAYPPAPVRRHIHPYSNGNTIVNLGTDADDMYDTYTYTYTYTPRGTMSLDMERPRPRAGGREIADDADLYALAKGARRPDYGRMRGESHAALLGRPDWIASAGGSASASASVSRQGSEVDLSRAATWAPGRGKKRAGEGEDPVANQDQHLDQHQHLNPHQDQDQRRNRDQDQRRGQNLDRPQAQDQGRLGVPSFTTGHRPAGDSATGSSGAGTGVGGTVDKAEYGRPRGDSGAALLGSLEDEASTR